MKKNVIKAAISLALAINLSTAVAATVSPLEQAEQALAQNQFTTSLSLSEQAIDANRNNVSAWIIKLKSQLRLNQLDDAEETVDDALPLFAQSGELHFYAAQVMSRQAQEANMFSALGYAKDAVKLYEKAVKLSPDNVDYQIGLFQFHLFAPGIAGGDKAVAQTLLQSIKQLDAKRGYNATSQYLLQLEKHDELKQHLSQVPSELLTDGEVLFNNAATYQRLDLHSEAIELFSRLSDEEVKTEDDSLSTAALYQIAKSADVGQTQLDVGKAAIEAYMALELSDTRFPPKAWAQFRLANILQHMGKQAEAKVLYQQIKASTDDKELLRALKKVS